MTLVPDSSGADPPLLLTGYHLPSRPQFIIISLRNNMFELADRLVGIYKTHNCTKSVTIDPRAFVLPGSVSAVAATTSTTTTKSTASIMDVGAEAAAGRRALRTRN